MRVAEQICGMKGRHDLDAEIVVKVAPQLANRNLCFEHILRGGRSEDYDDFWPDNGNLAFQKRLAGDSLIRFGSPIARRPAAVDVADKNVLASEADPLDYLGQ